MSVVPTIFNGLKGKADANTLASLPTTGAPNDSVHRPITKLNYYTLKAVAQEVSNHVKACIQQ
jgi:hypothetical protein